ncbi:glycosyl hydrolase family 8 [Nocardioides terrisoli]|uniref:glycosyl hydrolase family 8 n=1 Tax=Nocardioides terrisoli TaxID=3388267 RepID=UPI00287BC11F|nr:glycosyl hydrolase family 8 [Nocardioides marmorisolisilvae]
MAHFLDAYVTGDGRVLRHDQGDDIVSEGEAYGMLIAELAGRPDSVRTIWSWTKSHLQRPDKLLSFHADSNGVVQDHEPAADADVLAAFALLRYDGPGAGQLHRDGRTLSDAVLAHETVRVGDALVPVAGTWAVGPPAVVDPSYWMPGVFSDLARLTGDERWSAMAGATVRILAQATRGGTVLPPDWAVLDGGALHSTAAPDGSAPVQYGQDAARLPLWLAAACDGSARKLAAAWWSILSQPGRPTALALGTDGSVVNGSPSPVSMLAAAAAARAAGDTAHASELTGQATAQAQTTPTYYGDAWVALAAGLRDGALVRCR